MQPPGARLAVNIVIDKPALSESTDSPMYERDRCSRRNYNTPSALLREVTILSTLLQQIGSHPFRSNDELSTLHEEMPAATPADAQQAETLTVVDL